LRLKQIHLEVKENNEPAIAIYKSIGFIETTRNDGLVFMVARHEASQWEIE
jgi:ribosomal protein S18 acetylase RimI-like enzyme